MRLDACNGGISSPVICRFLVKILPQPFQKYFRSGRKNLIFFPYDIKSGIQTGFQRTETQAAVFGGIGNFVNRYGIAYSGIHHDSGVIYKVKGGNDIQFIEIIPEPFGKFIYIKAETVRPPNDKQE